MAIKGDIKIKISDNKLKAFLVYTPDKNGKSWDAGSFDELFKSEKIEENIDQKALEETLAEFSETESKCESKAIAHGTPAQDGVDESFEVINRDIPEDYKRMHKDILKQTPAPEIMVTKKEVVEEEGIFKKGQKKEIERKFKITVDPLVLESGFILSGEAIGNIIHAVNGKPGKTVTGVEIPCHTLNKKKNVLYLGNDVEKKAESIIAKSSGFWRKGNNWIDLISVEAHEWSLSVSKDKVNCFMKFKPGSENLPIPTYHDILQRVKEIKYDENHLKKDSEIERKIKDIVKLKNETTFPISQDRNAKIEIITDELKLTAKLRIEKGLGEGTPLVLKNIGPVIVKSKLKGIDQAKLKTSIMDFYNSNALEIDIDLCEGEKPERGGDRGLDLTVEFQEEENLSALKGKLEEQPELIAGVSSIKKFPVEKITHIASVTSGQKIFTIGKEKKGKDGKDVYGVKIPSIPGNDPIVHTFENINFKKGEASSSINGLLEFCEEENNFFVRVRKHIDAPVTVKISENKMSAYINIGLLEGTGFPADENRIMKALEANEVVAGIINENIEKAVEKSSNNEVVTDLVIAEGKMPMNVDSSLKLNLDIDASKNNSAPVKAGDILGEIQFNSDNSKGYTVTGFDLDAEISDGIELGLNVLKEEDEEKGSTILKAEKSGLLFFDGKQVYIQDTIVVNSDLTVAMGNVNFPGNVQIVGSVTDRVLIRAGESVHVKDVVQASLISADKNITVLKGIKGNGRGALSAQGAISIGFAEEATLMAVSDIKLGKAIMRCKVLCNGNLSSESNSKIVGGEIRCRNNLSVDSIGSPSGIVTKVHFGQDYLVQDQIAVVQKEIDKINLQMQKIDEIMKKMEETGNTARLMEARKKKVTAFKMLEKKNLRIFLLKEKFEQHFPATIKIQRQIYAGTVFESHGRSLEFKNDEPGAVIIFDTNSGKITKKAI